MVIPVMYDLCGLFRDLCKSSLIVSYYHSIGFLNYRGGAKFVRYSKYFDQAQHLQQEDKPITVICSLSDPLLYCLQS